MKLRTRIISAVLSAALFTTAITVPFTENSSVSSCIAYAAESTEAPVSSLKSGTYSTSSGKKITLKSNKKGAVIYYSLNGGEYKKYTSEITITKNSTLKAYAKYSGKKSKTVSYSYKLKPSVSISLKEGKYSSSQTVKLTTKAKNVKLYYTLDGSKPTTSSKKYTASGIKITKSCTLRVLAVKSGWSNSYYKKKYEINADGILNNYTKKYFYQQLNSTEKKLYAALFKGIADHKSNINFEDNRVSAETLDYVFELLRFENPQFFWLLDNYNYKTDESGLAYAIRPDYAYTRDESETMQAKIDKKADAIKKKLSSCKTEYDKVLLIHDEIVNNTVYAFSDNNNCYTLYGCLVDKKSVCQGYANAFSYLCQREGIVCVNVNGKMKSDDTQWHEWNRVKVDGKWYNMDVTWDDPAYSDQVLLHDYFLITDKQLKEDHITMDWFPFGKKEAATSTSLSYFKKEGLPYYRDADTAYKELIKLASSNYRKGVYKTTIYCHFNEIEALFHKLEKQEAYDDLGKYNAYPSSLTFSYEGNVFVLEMKK